MKTFSAFFPKTTRAKLFLHGVSLAIFLLIVVASVYLNKQNSNHICDTNVSEISYIEIGIGGEHSCSGTHRYFRIEEGSSELEEIVSMLNRFRYETFKHEVPGIVLHSGWGGIGIFPKDYDPLSYGSSQVKSFEFEDNGVKVNETNTWYYRSEDYFGEFRKKLESSAYDEYEIFR